MPIYDKSTKELMRDWASSNLEIGQVFEKPIVVQWFNEHYPNIKPNTVSMHVEGFATNNARHRSHHGSIRSDSGWDLFFKIGPNKFRLWEPETDPDPRYDLTENENRENDEDTDGFDEDYIGSLGRDLQSCTPEWK